MSNTASVSATLSLWVARGVGGLCALAFFGLSTITGGFFIDFHPPFTHVGQGEANLWLGSTLLLFPASCLLGYGFHPQLGRVIEWLRAQLASLDARERRLALLCLTALAIASARLCNAIVLLGFPVTDDEWAARFGGEVLASGQLAAALPFEQDAFPSLFTFVFDGRITSLDWLGVQVPWALSALSKTGNWVFAIAAATPVACITWLLCRRLSPSWAVAGALLFFCSPMAFALSMSTHAHLCSRALIALVLALFVRSREQPSHRLSLALGLALGLAIICRPFEVCSLLAPLFLVEAWFALRHGDRTTRARFMLMTLGVLLPVAVFFWHAHALTGGFTPPRHHPLAVGAAPTVEHSYWVRFGSNSGFNALRLAVWFAGPLGLALFAAGALVDSFTRLLSLGLLSALAVGLFHDNYGVHVVGPIHYSECVVPLTIVAIHGLARLTRKLRSLELRYDLPAAVAAVWMVFGMGAFNVVHARSLHEMALAQSIVYERIERLIPHEQRPAVLFAPRLAQVWSDVPAFSQRGTWVFEWRRPQPDFRDPVMILHDFSPSAVRSVRAALASRHFFQLQLRGPDELFAIVRAP